MHTSHPSPWLIDASYVDRGLDDNASTSAISRRLGRGETVRCDDAERKGRVDNFVLHVDGWGCADGLHACIDRLRP